MALWVKTGVDAAVVVAAPMWQHGNQRTKDSVRLRDLHDNTFTISVLECFGNNVKW